MTQPQTEIPTPYAPLPVRARGTLEIFDTAFKLFRRYAGVLLAWSAISSIVNLIPFFGGMIYIFTMPLMFGAVSCVVAGAVRGQNVGFKQIWGFTKPRYGALLGVLILAVIMMGMVALGLLFVVGFGVALVGAAAYNFGWFATGVTWIVGLLVGLVASSFLLAMLLGWFNLAPVIVCLEDANRGSNSLSRAWSLLSGNWRKACGVATILFLAGTAAWVILVGFAVFFFGGGWDKFVGFDMSSISMLATWAFVTLFFLAWTPLQAVVGAVFYLDLRTRKEALDLEWTNYAAKPETLPGQEPSVAPAPTYAPAPPAPAVGPAYTPASSSQGGPTFASAAQVPPSPPPVNLPQQEAPTIVAAQSPAQMPTAEVAPAVAPVPAPQGEVPPQNGEPFTPLIPTAVETAPVPASINPVPVVPGPVASIEPEVAFQPPFVPTEPAPVALDGQSGAGNLEPVVTSVPFPIPPAPTPVGVAPEPEPLVAPKLPSATAPTPEPIVAPLVPPAPLPTPLPEPAPEPEATSSFAPRRFRRAASEDDDYPSSFGGGAR